MFQVQKNHAEVLMTEIYVFFCSKRNKNHLHLVPDRSCYNISLECYETLQTGEISRPLALFRKLDNA
jgi:hypothetical protein